MNGPGSSYDAMLKILKIELEFILDLDMYVFFEQGTKVVVSYISNRCSKVNNKYLKPYNPKRNQIYHIKYNISFT